MSNTVWSLATLTITDIPCFDAIADKFLSAVIKHQECETQAVANTAWAFATVAYVHGPLFAALASEVMTRVS